MPKTSYVDAAIFTLWALTEALTNPAPAAPFAQFGDAQQQVIVDLAEIFESAIVKPALPSIVPLQPTVRTVTPPSMQVPILPESPRVTVPPSSRRANVPPAAPRAKIPPASNSPSLPTLSLPVHPHVIDLEYNSDNVNAIAAPRYRLRLHHQQRPFVVQVLRR